MQTLWRALALPVALAGLLLVGVPSIIRADANCEHGEKVGNKWCENPPAVAAVAAATPELDSLVLFGAGPSDWSATSRCRGAAPACSHLRLEPGLVPVNAPPA